ncbi:MAG TPA: mucoidy inhibitor MuiA family protein, partial [Dongiaceae bacterium]|nr:mucoidy inhibitor MuiA family protein [Dongiaceae bacterium]
MRSALALLLLPAIVSGAYAADVKGTSRIDAVTVYPSGAEITRVGKVKLEAGDHVILFTDLPVRALHSSIRVEGKATGALEIGSVDSRRTFVPRTDAAVAATDRKRIEDAIEKLKDDRAVLQAAVQAAEAQKKLIGNLAELPTRPAPATGAAAPQPDWAQLFGIIGERLAEAQRAVLETQIKVREVDRQIKDLEGKLAALAPAQEERTEVKIFVNAGAPLDADIAIRYQVGSASWLQFYDARLTTGTKAQAPKLQLVRRASIQQRSGESWDNVALALSTARPGAGTAAPDLRPVTIDYEPDAPPPRPQAVGAARSLTRDAVAPAPAAGQVAAVDEDQRRVKSAPEPVKAEEASAKIETQAFQAIYAIAGRVTVP